MKRQIIARRRYASLYLSWTKLSLTQDNQLTTAISEEITGSISLEALDAYVAAVLAHDTSVALKIFDVIFRTAAKYGSLITDLLQYLRDLLIVKTGGENTHTVKAFRNARDSAGKDCLS